MPSRRETLSVVGSGAIIGVAGCLDEVVDGTRGATTESPSNPDESDPDPLDDETLEGLSELGRQVRESVVVLEGELSGRGQTASTAFCFREAGMILTNAHNLRGASDFTVWTIDGERYSAEVRGTVESQIPDLALLSADGMEIPPLAPGSSDGLERGDPLLQVGHPSIMGNWVITVGPFRDRQSVLSTDGEEILTLESDVPGMQGNSGSPLVNRDGEVVGVTNGSRQADTRGPDDPPVGPASDEAHTELVGRVISRHESVEIAEKKYDEWV